MISLYTGSVGSGKSYHALELGLEWVKRGKHVVANFPIRPPKKFLFSFMERKWDKMLQNWHFRDEITVEYLMSISIENDWFGKESQCLVLIDEAGIMFNSRDWQHERQSRQKWIKFLSQSRKFGFDFIFICQSDRMIDRQIRGLVEYEVKHRKANNASFFKWLSLFKITMFVYAYKWYQTKLPANVSVSFYRPWIASRYDTMRIFNLDDLIDSMRSIYQGKVIPAPIAQRIAIWQGELEEQEKRKQQQKKEEQKIFS